MLFSTFPLFVYHVQLLMSSLLFLEHDTKDILPPHEHRIGFSIYLDTLLPKCYKMFTGPPPFKYLHECPNLREYFSDRSAHYSLYMVYTRYTTAFSHCSQI